MYDWQTKLFHAEKQNFKELCIETYHHQRKFNKVYSKFCEYLIGEEDVNTLTSIPFIPIQFFKTDKLICSNITPKLCFESSGTTGMIKSRHYIADPALYEESFMNMFIKTYGEPAKFSILGLLPSYLEQGNSSLVYMVYKLIKASGKASSGFYLNDHKGLSKQIKENERTKQPTILFGVTYALLDFSDNYYMPLNYTTIIETGGMKGRKKELTKNEIHDHLKSRFNVEHIHAEYGMTELLSQAYSKGNNLYQPAETMEICIRAQDDPLEIFRYKDITVPKSGLVNIIDLCNIHSCSFIATDDIGTLHPDGTFEILGRNDNTDIRGCSLLTA